MNTSYHELSHTINKIFSDERRKKLRSQICYFELIILYKRDSKWKTVADMIIAILMSIEHYLQNILEVLYMEKTRSE